MQVTTMALLLSIFSGVFSAEENDGYCKAVRNHPLQHTIQEFLFPIALHSQNILLIIVCFLTVILVSKKLLFPQQRQNNNLHSLIKQLKRTVTEDELKILHESSMDVTWELFFRLHRNNNGKPSNNDKSEEDEWNELLLQLINMIKAPTPPPTTTSDRNCFRNLHHHQEKLRVLGSAIWFRFHVRRGIDTEALRELIHVCKKKGQYDLCLHGGKEHHADTRPEMGYNNIATSTPFNVKSIIISWAVCPRDRDLVNCCLDALAWFFRQEKDSNISVPALPEPVLTSLIEEIIKAYICSTGIAKQQGESEPELISVRNGNCAPSTILIDQRTTLDEPFTALLDTRLSQKGIGQTERCAKRILGLLYLLNILTGPTSLQEVDPKDQGMRAENGDNNSRNPNYRLRSGILSPPTNVPVLSCVWAQTLLLRLMKQVEVTKACTYETKKSVDNSMFLLHKLPTLAIQLKCYQLSVQLLHHNPEFTKTRLSYLGLYHTVQAFIEEWSNLEGRLLDALLLASDIRSLLKANSSLTCLAHACLSQSSDVANMNFNHRRMSQLNIETALQETAQACYLLGNYIHRSPWSDQTILMAFQLLSQARHLQLLALKRQCHAVSSALHNLAFTLWARLGVSKKRFENKSNIDKAFTLLPETYHEVSHEILEDIKKIERKYSKDDSILPGHTLASMGCMLAQTLSRSWRKAQPLIETDERERPNNVWRLPLNTITGITVRQLKIQEHFQAAHHMLKVFATIQTTCNQLHCELLEAQATEELLGILSQSFNTC